MASFYNSAMDGDSIQYISQEKYEALKQELSHLKIETIPGIAKRIDEARQMGDLSENAEYHSAREEMSWARTREKELSAILDNVSVIDSSVHIGTDSISLGSKVLVDHNGIQKKFTIVGAQEANPAEGNISNESPLGLAFLGHAMGDEVEVKTPAGLQLYRIIDIA